MAQSPGNSAWDDIASMIQPDMAEQVHVRVQHPDGSVTVHPLFRRTTLIDERTGSICKVTELAQIVDGAGNVISPRDGAGVCARCGALMASVSFGHCARCGVGQCRTCAHVYINGDGQESLLCKACFRKTKCKARLNRVLRGIAAFFVKFEDD